MLHEDQLQELLAKYFPPHLRGPAAVALGRVVKGEFPETTNADLVYRRQTSTAILFQGDALIDVPFAVLNPEMGTASVEYFDAMILNNTCDISEDNPHLDEPLASFGLIIPLSLYEEALLRSVSQERVDNHLRDVRSNRISNLLYLPAVPGMEGRMESIVRFDWVFSIPYGLILKWSRDYLPNGDRIFTLSDYGFYVLLFKLSVHFCRMGEAIDRGLL